MAAKKMNKNQTLGYLTVAMQSTYDIICKEYGITKNHLLAIFGVMTYTVGHDVKYIHEDDGRFYDILAFCGVKDYRKALRQLYKKGYLGHHVSVGRNMYYINNQSIEISENMYKTFYKRLEMFRAVTEFQSDLEIIPYMINIELTKVFGDHFNTGMHD
jgi:hypothetical protein